MDKFLDDQFRRMRVVAVKQRIQILVIAEEMDSEDENPKQITWIAGTIDQPIPIPYEQ